MMTTGPRPLNSGTEAAALAVSFVGLGVYNLHDGGDCMRPLGPATPKARFDCWGLVCKALGLRRHRPGYNRKSGALASVVDDINGDSACQDALYGGAELFSLVTDRPQVGDILSYPSITLLISGVRKQWIGHGAVVVDISSVLQWNPARPVFSSLGTVECTGPDGHYPAINRGTGAVFDRRSRTWSKEEHRARLLRAASPVAPR